MHDMQVADRLNSMGVPCNLVTGQETRSTKGARHTACTVEMADLNATVDVSMRAVCWSTACGAGGGWEVRSGAGPQHVPLTLLLLLSVVSSLD
jgi:hypothetical protein